MPNKLMKFFLYFFIIFFCFCQISFGFGYDPPEDLHLDPIPKGYVYPGYTNPPDWRVNPYYTHQSWDFLSITTENGTLKEPKAPYKPDAENHTAPWVNNYGTPLFTETGWIKLNAPRAWVWADNGMMMGCSYYYGMYGGLGNGYVKFSIPNTTEKREVWLQYIAYFGHSFASCGLFSKNGPETLVSKFCSDPALTMPTGRMLKRTAEKIKGPAKKFGKWYRITELWKLDGGSGVDYLYLATPKSFASLFEAVDIDTRRAQKK